MSRNKAVQASETDAFIQRIAAMERELAALKTTQPVGAANVDLTATPESVLTQVIAPGQWATPVLQFQGQVKRLFQSELALSFYIGRDDDLATLWPNGTGAAALERSVHYDLRQSDETGEGTKAYVVTMKNPGTSPITVYMHWRLVYPRQTVTDVT